VADGLAEDRLAEFSQPECPTPGPEALPAEGMQV